MTDPIKKENQETEPAPKSKMDTAFLQVPFALKEEVEQYIQKLMSGSDKELTISDDNIKSLPDQGCFLVISLDKIELIINELKSCLAMEPDNEARNIKSVIRKTLGLLS